MSIREKVMMIQERAICEAYEIAYKSCPLSTCDIETLGELVDIAKDTFEIGKTAMEVAENTAAQKCEFNPHA